MTDFITTVRETLAAAKEALLDAQKGLLLEAENQRQELLALQDRMHYTAEQLGDLAHATATFAEEMGAISDESYEVADVIVDTLCIDIPECQYTEFRGFCADCGRTITKDEEYAIIPNGILCPECDLADYEDEEEDEEEETDDLEAELPEGVIDDLPSDESCCAECEHRDECGGCPDETEGE